MLVLLGIVAMIAGIASFVCWVIVLTKLFPDEGVLAGLFGIICGIYAFIWGWTKVDKHGLQQVMLIWTAAWVIGLIFQIISVVASAS